MTIWRVWRVGLSRRFLMAVIACAGCTLSVAIHAEAQSEQLSVLTVHATRREAPAPILYDQALQRILGQNLQGRLDYYSEYLDTARFGDPDFQRAFRDFLTIKYAGRRFDVLILTGDAALELMNAFGDELFVGVPVVFQGSPNVKAGTRSTGVTYSLDLARTLTMVTQLQPDTKHVFVVSGSSPFDKYYEGLARKQLNAFEDRFDLTYWSGLPMPELLERVAHLPPDSIVYPLAITEDGSGQRFLPLDAFDRVATAANAPVYTWVTPAMGRGVVGGSMASPEIVAERLATLALRVLDGQKPEDIPRVEIDPYIFEVDWRQLRRWGISEARVPAGTTIRFRQLSVWDQYRLYIIGTVGLLLVETALISGLLVQRVRRRRAEGALRESEERFRVLADTAPVMIWQSGVDKACHFFNQPWLEFRGRAMEQEMGSGWAEGVHPADLDECLMKYTSAFDQRRSFRMEYRLQRADGEYRWVLDSGVPRRTSDGAFAGYVSSCVDITERIWAEAELRVSEAALRRSLEQNHDLAGRLIAAQEAERTRIARDLHDDVCQELAGVAMMLSTVKGRLGRSDPERHVEEALTAVEQRTGALADNIRNLSHELHSGVLQHAGLVAALEDLCTEFGRHRHIDVTFSADDDIDPVEPPVALCLYRVVQEVLTNTARHAHARAAQVRLTRTAEGLELDVVDDGIGFDSKGQNGSGLGLRSIGERVRLAGGSVRIESQRGQGTRLAVQIPISAATRPDLVDQP